MMKKCYRKDFVTYSISNYLACYDVGTYSRTSNKICWFQATSYTRCSFEYPTCKLF